MRVLLFLLMIGLAVEGDAATEVDPQMQPARPVQLHEDPLQSDLIETFVSARKFTVGAIEGSAILGFVSLHPDFAKVSGGLVLGDLGLRWGGQKYLVYQKDISNFIVNQWKWHPERVIGATALAIGSLSYMTDTSSLALILGGASSYSILTYGVKTYVDYSTWANKAMISFILRQCDRDPIRTISATIGILTFMHLLMEGDFLSFV